MGPPETEMCKFNQDGVNSLPWRHCLTPLMLQEAIPSLSLEAMRSLCNLPSSILSFTGSLLLCCRALRENMIYHDVLKQLMQTHCSHI